MNNSDGGATLLAQAPRVHTELGVGMTAARVSCVLKNPTSVVNATSQGGDQLRYAESSSGAGSAILIVCWTCPALPCVLSAPMGHAPAAIPAC